MKILLIEDDEVVIGPLVQALSEQHYLVNVATNGETGAELANSFDYDLILMDVGLPKVDGITLCQQLRASGNQTPILLLTALDTSTNKVKGLDAGADDYVTKPYDWAELSARIRALLRRGSSTLAPYLQWEQLKLLPNTREVFYQDQPMHLTPKEYDLLELFLRNPQRVYSRGAILEHLWEFEELPEEETIRSHIRGLRNKLKTAGAPDPIETVYGIGYRLKPVARDQSVSPPSPPPEPTPETKPSPPPSRLETEPSGSLRNRLSADEEQKTVEAIANLWERVRKKFSARVEVIEQASTAMSECNLSPNLRQQAEQEAHRLAGSLGIYNLVEGSRLAQEMEVLLHSPAPLSSQQQKHLANLVIALREELEKSSIPQKMSSEAVPQATTEDESIIINQPKTYTILAVDDDHEVLLMLRHIIEPWGIQLVILNTPEHFWETLAQVAPDLLILDVALPQASGIELCQAVRNDLRWGDLPVLFLTAYTDTNTMQQVFTAGADDYVSKPVVGPELMTRILNRLERSRLRRNVMEMDILTKVANRRKVTRELQHFFAQADQHHTAVGFAILHLDSIQQINEQQGYQAGDEALSWFGMMLSHHFHSQECVARWGGVTFVVGMYGIDAQTGQQRLAQFRDALHHQALPGEGDRQFHLTFSAGIGEYPRDGSDLTTLYSAVNQAVKQAQEQGGDQIIILTTQSSQNH